MSNLMNMLSTGVSGLFAAQAQIDVAGNNTTNVNTEGYTRQRVSLTTAMSQTTATGVYGRGVSIDSVVQIYDSLLASTLRTESSDLSYYTTLQNNLEAVEIYFNELEDGSGLGEAMSAYFDAWSDLANTATDDSDESQIKKQTVIETAVTLSEKIRDSYEYLTSLQDTANTQIEGYVSSVNEIAQNIAYLNGEIAAIEVTGVTANDLRDTREGLLNDLAELTDITVSDRNNGQIAVFVNGHALVDEGQSYYIAAEQTDAEDNTYQIYWAASSKSTEKEDITSSFTTGSIGAMLDIRDEILTGYKETLDELASSLITETNQVHSLGQGTDRLTQITSANGVANSRYALNEPAGSFDTPVTEGVMRITVYDEDGNIINNYDIEIDPSTDSLNSIINKISASDGNVNGGDIQATLSQDNTIKITAGSGLYFAFTEDTSGFLVASGTYGFFTGSDASDIDVSSLLQENSSYLATSLTGAEGDNQNATAIAALKSEGVVGDTKVTFDEFYALFAADIATDKASADTYAETKQNAVDEYTLKMESISGVSIDEELTDLMKFQRAYEASARFITVIDEMLDKVVNGLGTGGR